MLRAAVTVLVAAAACTMQRAALAVPVSPLLEPAAGTSSGPAGLKPDPAWQPRTPFELSALGGVSACAVGASDKEVFVGQRGKTSPSIIVLDAKTGNYSRGFGQGVFKNVHGMHMQGKYLWVTDSGASMVHKFDSESGKLLASIGEHGTGLSPNIQFGSVADVAFDAAGAVYISDGDGGCNARVIKLDASLKLVWAIGNNGTGAPPLKQPFNSPHSLAYSAETDTVFVADRNNNQLRAFDAKTGEEANATWSTVFQTSSPACDKPAVWSVRTVGQVLVVATSNFGSGSACPGVPAAGHLGRVLLLPLPRKGDMSEPTSIYVVPLAHGFPHEICTASNAGHGVYAAAVDSKDLPQGAGIAALTKYTLQAM